MWRLVALAAIGALALAAAGCGETLLDATKTEEQLESSLEKSLPSAFEGKAGQELAEEIGVSAGEGIESVECPTDQEVETGAEFTCTVTFDNGSQAYETLKIVNDNADLNALGLSAEAE
jgi:Domain of unknown function (DUF4333)